MEFEMKYKLRGRRAHEITVLVDAAGDDCLLSLKTPFSFGVALAEIISMTWLEMPEIEEAAWRSYQERLKQHG